MRRFEMDEKPETPKVFKELLLDTGRRFEYRIFGEDLDAVLDYAREQKLSIDPYRSPSLGAHYKYYRYQDNGVYWAVNLNYWGL